MRKLSLAPAPLPRTGTTACPRGHGFSHPPLPGRYAVPSFHGDAERLRLAFLQGMQIVEPLDEEQIGDLLDHREGIGYTAGPEGVPDLIDLIPDFAGAHGSKDLAISGV